MSLLGRTPIVTPLITTTVLLAGFLAPAAGCNQKQDLVPYAPQKPDYNQPLPPGALALRKIDPKDYPDFRPAFSDREGLEEAIRNSIEYLRKPSSQKYFPYGDVSHDRALASLQNFLQVLHNARSADEFDAIIRRDYDVYQSVGYNGRGVVYFTGYYTPIFEGRKHRGGPFQYPLYRRPPDLVSTNEGQIEGRRTADGSIVPYRTRREIEEGRLLEGTEIAFVRDPFEAYVITVQGSAKLRLEDGTLFEIGYAGNNGHDYTPIAEQMIKDGVIRKEELSLQTLMRYFRAHPDKITYYTWQNPRYVFFKEAPGGPFGSLGVPVLPYRSIATDKSVFPRACLALVKAPLPHNVGGTVQTMPTCSFTCDQDTGGAIRAAGRCDVFMGIGAGAEDLAGRTGAEGALYYIFVKSSSGQLSEATPLK